MHDSQADTKLVWTDEMFVRAWEQGVFGDVQVELLEGELWRRPVSIGFWHGDVVMNTGRALPNGGAWQVSSSSLPSSGSVPDPDVWVRRASATPTSQLGPRISRWDPADVGLVVEVSDTTFERDTTTKARIYGRARFSEYWVVHRAGVEVFSEPHDLGYRSRRSYLPGDLLPVPYAPDISVDVSTMIAGNDE